MQKSPGTTFVGK